MAMRRALIWMSGNVLCRISTIDDDKPKDSDDSDVLASGIESLDTDELERSLQDFKCCRM
jgi:hypothetical protein